MIGTKNMGGIKVAYRENTADLSIAVENILRDDYRLKSIAQQNGVFVDLGAYGGYVSLLAASLGMKVLAVEPLPANVELIRENIRLNDWGSRMRVVEGAFGTEKIFWNDTTNPAILGHRFVANSSGSPGCQSIAVADLSLDELLAPYPEIHIIKTDCEGGEWKLPTQTVVHRTNYIVGEFHTIDNRSFKDFASLFDAHEDVSANYGIAPTEGLRLFVFKKR